MLPRKPRFKRVSDQRRLTITERDLRILMVVGRHRFVQSHHLLKLIPGSRQHLLRRLARLFHANLLSRPREQVYVRDRIGPTFAYCLTTKGEKTLKARSFPLPPPPKHKATVLSLAHFLKVTDVLVTIEADAFSNGLVFSWPFEWSMSGGSKNRLPAVLRWPVTSKRSLLPLKTWLIPDGAFSLQSPKGRIFYFVLEVDRGTMPVFRRNIFQSSFHKKVLLYKESRYQSVLWKHFQIPSFRVLVVAESKRRIVALQQATAASFKNGKSEMFLFATAPEIPSVEGTGIYKWQTCSGKELVLDEQ